MLKKTFIATIVLLLLLVVGCVAIRPSVNLETFVIIDRQTGVVYYPDMDPKPGVEGEVVTFTQDGKAYILSGNWMIVVDIDNGY